MYKLVDGTNDYLPAECSGLFELSDKIMNVFTRRGYRRVDTPVLERYELFSRPECGVNINSLFKFGDTDGTLVVMRPDMTMPIARLAATKAGNPDGAKFCYSCKSFIAESGANALREFTQVGVENYAGSDAYVDADTIILAIEGLKQAGLKAFQIEIGHVGYFKGLLNELNLNDEEEKQIIDLVNSKDKFGLMLFASGRDKNPVYDDILNLPLMFGSAEILRRLLDNTRIKESRAAIENLMEIHSYIERLGYAEYLSYDLSLVNGVMYYSGVVFKGITKYYGSAVLSGGRYDGLSRVFGKELPATGFAIGANRLMAAIMRESDARPEEPHPDVLIGGDYKNHACKIKELIDNCLLEGKTAENSYLDDLQAHKARAKELRAGKSLFVTASGEIIE